MNIPLKITVDKNVDLKKLRKLEQQGKIEIIEVKIENTTNKVNNKVLPLAVLGHTRLGEMLLADNNSFYDHIVKIIGVDKVRDAIILDAHIRSKNDYFVTNDKDTFINYCKRERLEKSFPNLEIVTVIELEHIINKKDSLGK